METVKPSDAAALEAAEEQRTRESDEQAMSALVDEVPIAEEDPETPPPAEPEQPPATDPLAKVEPSSEAGQAPAAAPPPPAAAAPPAAADAAEETPEAIAARHEAEIEAEVDEALKDIPVPPNASPFVKKALKSMRERVRTQTLKKREAQASEATKSKQLEEALAKAAELAEISPEELAEFKQQRRALFAEKDPDFQAKFVAPVKVQEADVMSILRGHKLPDAVASWIEEEGGIFAIYQSSKPYLVDGAPQVDANGNTVTQSDWFRQNILENQALTAVQRDEIRDSLAAVRQLARVRDKALQEAKKGGEEFAKKQAEAEVERQKVVAAVFDDEVEHIAENLKEAGQLVEAKPDATPEEKKAVEAHNERVKAGVAKVRAIKADLLHAKDYGTPEFAKRLAEVAISAAQAEYLHSTNLGYQEYIKSLRTRLESAESQLSKIKAARGSSRMNAAPVPRDQKAVPVTTHDDEKAMEELMERHLPK